MNILYVQYGNLKNPYAHGGLPHANHEVMKRLTKKHNVTHMIFYKASMIKLSISDTDIPGRN